METRRLGLIGPVLPFRGGIAQHTTRLHRALRARATVTTISFTRQYPRWLFPGESDRDPSYEGHLEPGVQYVLDPLSPPTWRRAVRLLVEADVEAVVIPWWTVYFACPVAYLKRSLQRRGIRVVFLCHNVVDHETAAYKRWLSRMVLAGAHGYCTQARAEADKLKSFLPGARVVAVPHPLYDHFPLPRGHLERRANLELLFFGFVRPYKGVDVLLDAVARLERDDLHLSVVGEFWQGKDATIRRLHELGIASRVEVVPRFVSEQEAVEYFARADGIVLPYRHATGSGIVALAYQHGKPVIASRVGGFIDVVEDGRTGYLVEPGSAPELARVLERITRQELQAMRPHIDAGKARMSWDALVDALLELIE